ncbi:MAG: hypothetical protein PHG29_11805, partial [Prolixibacteraceae bacterium]|nr:hypothetical protein [Prolixibacteraceae bacterium]
MFVFDNPFYIIGVSPRDSKSRIVSKVDEINLLTGTLHNDEQNILLNPQKRIMAEISWFPGVAPKTVEKILNNIETTGNIDEIKYENFDDIVQINIILAKLSKIIVNDIYNIVREIIELDRIILNIDLQSILYDINSDRITSSFPEIESIHQIENVFNDYVDEIIKFASRKLQELEMDSYVSVITTIADKYINNNIQSGALINELIEKYEMYIQSQLYDIHESMKKLHDKLKLNNSNKSKIANELISIAMEWGKLVQPLQLVAKFYGTSHIQSKDIAITLRDIALDMHNSYGETSLALLITQTMANLFKESPDFNVIIQEDLKTLKKLEAERLKIEEEEKEGISRNQEDIIYKIRIYSKKIYIPPYCTCCLVETRNTETLSSSITTNDFYKKTTTISMDFPICDDCLSHRKSISKKKWILVILSSIIGIFSFPVIHSFGKDDNIYVYSVLIGLAAYIILGFLWRTKNLPNEHSSYVRSAWITDIAPFVNGASYYFTNWHYAKLFSEANNSEVEEYFQRNRAKPQSLLKALESPILNSLLVIIIVIGISFIYGNNIIGQNNNTSLTSQQIQNSNNQNKNTTSNTQTKKQRLDSIEGDLSNRLIKINAMERKLNNLEQDIEHNEYMYS